MNNSYKEFLTNEAPVILAGLKSDTPSKFGLMTPQHMVEHLIMLFKVSCKRYGDSSEPNKSALNFRKFVDSGAVFKHFESKAPLAELRMENLETAIEAFPAAVNRFYSHYEANPDFKGFNMIQGELSGDDFELVHYQHTKYHLAQFGLMDYPTVT